MSDFEIYVQKYAAKHRISIDEAKQHALVKAVEMYYSRNDKDIKWW